MIDLIFIFIYHYFSDFICQSHKMSLNKSKSILWLTYHILIYSTVTTLGWILYSPELSTLGCVFSITFITHWITDFFTSKWSSYLYSKNSINNFFLVIVLDQLIHATTLILTYNYLIKTIL